MDELKVMDLLRVFQRYFFMEAGDWAEHLTEALCATTAQHDTLHEHSVQSMLEGSFKGSSVEQDPSAAKLRVSLRLSPGQQLQPTRSRQAAPASRASPQQAGAFPNQKQHSSCSRSVIVDSSQLKAFEAVHLSYEVDWPLSLVVTQVRLHQTLSSHKEGGCHSIDAVLQYCGVDTLLTG